VNWRKLGTQEQAGGRHVFIGGDAVQRVFTVVVADCLVF
jgi:hypothetical protein